MKAKQKLMVILLIGGLLAFFSWQTGDEKKEDATSLESVLSTIEGVGAVKVYYEQKQEESSLFLSFSQEQTQLSGILIVCEGATSEHTKRMIVDAVSAVLGISPHNIKVLPMQREE